MSEPIEGPTSPPAPAPAARRSYWPVVAGVAFLLAALVLGLDVHRSWQGRSRRALIARMERSDRPLTAPEIERAARQFRGDRELLGASLLLARDAKAGDAARLNAILLSAALAPRAEGPAKLGQLEWQDGTVSGARFVDLTFERGHFTSVRFADSTFAGVTWGAAFSGGRSGLVLNRVRFAHGRFESGAFAGTHLSDVEILDSTFSGVSLDLSNFDHVRFRRSAGPAGPADWTSAAIVRGVVVNHGHAPPAGVDDLSLPTDQVSFTGIAFDGVHFRGWIRPEWFSGCTFKRCVFPAALSRDTLAAGHNTLTACLWSDEPAD